MIVDINDSESIEMAPVWKRIVVNNTFETSPVVESSEGGKIETTTMEKKPVDPETFPVLLLGNKFDLVIILNSNMTFFFSFWKQSHFLIATFVLKVILI